MDERLLALRAKLKEQKAATETRTSGGSGDKRFYRFFDLPFDGTATKRFLGDGDATNPFWFVEKQMFSWEFADPDTPGGKVRINMPCRNMYAPRTCPVSQMISKQYETNDTAKSMWVNKKYIYQGFVRSSDLTEEDAPENPIRLYEYTKKLHTRIKTAIEDEGEETSLPGYPFDYKNGINFIVKKTKQGEHANYDESKFSSKTSALTDDELAAIEQYGLFNLKELLPPQPSEEQFALQPEMAAALLAGEPWNPEWETLWKPYRPNQTDEDGTATKTKAPKETSDNGSSDSDDEPTAAASPAASAKADSIMERLAKARAAKAAE